MEIIKVVMFECSRCGNLNKNEFDKGDSSVTCKTCGKKHLVSVRELLEEYYE